jgi:hypothetical protein
LKKRVLLRHCGNPKLPNSNDKSGWLKLIFIHRVFRKYCFKYISLAKFAGSMKRGAINVDFANLFIDNCMKVKANTKVKLSCA